jgi:energy-coupling factor transport system substrate-specific component
MMMAVQLGTSAVTMPFAFVNLALSPGLAALVNGHLFVLVARRTARRGPFMILMAFESLAFVMAGYWFEALYLVPLGVAGEALMGRGGYRDLRRIVLLWTANGFMGAGVNILPVVMAREAFAKAALRDGFDAAYVQSYFDLYASVPFAVGIALYGAAMAWLGARSGARLARRHLRPAGLEGVPGPGLDTCDGAGAGAVSGSDDGAGAGVVTGSDGGPDACVVSGSDGGPGAGVVSGSDGWPGAGVVSGSDGGPGAGVVSGSGCGRGDSCGLGRGED